jgi:hypothetical protein
MKKRMKAMIIFSKAPPKMKAIVGKEMMTNRNSILLKRTTTISSEEFFHHEYLSQNDTKIAF